MIILKLGIAYLILIIGLIGIAYRIFSYLHPFSS